MRTSTPFKLPLFVPMLSLLLLACTGAKAPSPEATVRAPDRQTTSPKPTREQDWQATVAAARKEGSVSIITRFPPTTRDALASAFKEKYGIEVESASGNWSELWAKVEAERRSGIYARDLVTASIPGLMSVLAAGAAEPLDKVLVLPEVVDGEVWRDKKLPFYDKENKVLKYIGRVGPTMAVNTDTVKPDELKSWRNLLDPKWKGQIIMHDPSIGGTGSGITAALSEIMGVDYLRGVAKQNPVITRDLRGQIESVARGKYPIALGFDFIMMEEMRRFGAPLGHVVPAEGTYFGSALGSISLLSKPAHPNAAKVFINWFLSREGQTVMVQASKEQSRRLDVPVDMAPDRLFKEGIRYIDSDTEYMVKKMLEMMRTSREIFAAQLK